MARRQHSDAGIVKYRQRRATITREMIYYLREIDRTGLVNATLPDRHEERESRAR